jgi:hypothetical protein
MRKKNKKRTNPRYFLHETAYQEWGQSDELIGNLARIISGDICKSADNVYHGARDLFAQIDSYTKAGKEAKYHCQELIKTAQDIRIREEGGRPRSQAANTEVLWSFANQSIRHIERLYRTKTAETFGDGAEYEDERLSQKVKDLAQCPEGDERYGR